MHPGRQRRRTPRTPDAARGPPGRQAGRRAAGQPPRRGRRDGHPRRPCTPHPRGPATGRRGRASGAGTDGGARPFHRAGTGRGAGPPGRSTRWTPTGPRCCAAWPPATRWPSYRRRARSPFTAGTILGGPAWLHLPLFVCWLLAYTAAFHLQQYVRLRRLSRGPRAAGRHVRPAARLRRGARGARRSAAGAAALAAGRGGRRATGGAAAGRRDAHRGGGAVRRLPALLRRRCFPAVACGSRPWG
ncbi:YwiC-like family protein [Streptomyces sp. NPDC048442]|uniref:YwiC-like family protein n=1 Tax=Streptomyces sp. NPDC048442 TaxID=3154823 RepID=UPI0034260FBD